MTPQHYNKNIQPLEYIEANGLDFAEGNVIKYVTRYKEKGGLDDLLKAKSYLQVLINRYNESESFTVKFAGTKEEWEFLKSKQEEVLNKIKRHGKDRHSKAQANN